MILIMFCCTMVLLITTSQSRVYYQTNLCNFCNFEPPRVFPFSKNNYYDNIVPWTRLWTRRLANSSPIWEERFPQPQAMTEKELFCSAESFGAGATLQRCLVTWHLVSCWLHGMMISTQLCIILMFKLSREHIYRGLKKEKKDNIKWSILV